MPKIRLLARLDIKGPNLIKGIHLEGLRVLGEPHTYAKRYYEDGADEILYMDTVASLYGRNNLSEIVSRTAQDIFIPLTVGGGIRSVDDAKELLRAGADKIAVNTAAAQRPQIITEIATRLGSQCMVLSIEAKKGKTGQWEAMTDNGREHTGLDVIQWAKKGQGLGAGEILLTSIDQEGTRKGFDLDLVRAVSDSVTIPVIASGGMGSMQHLFEVVNSGHADAIAVADMIHYNRAKISDIRKYALENNISTRIV